MSGGLLDLMARFAGLRVGVVGEAMLDSYLMGSASGLCREAPVPTVTLADRTNLPGGAANAAVNVAALGAAVSFCSIIGSDLEAMLLRKGLRVLGVGTEHLWQHPRRRTLTKTRIVSDSQILIRFDDGTAGPIDGDCERRLCRRLEDLFDGCDAIILSDYDKGLLTPRVLDAVARLQSRRPRLLVVDARDLSRYGLVRPTAVKPSYTEAARLLGLHPPAAGGDRPAQVAGSGDRLLDMLGCELAAVTLDRDGAMLFEQGHAPYRTYSRPVLDARALGAGDTYTAALTLALAAGAPTHTAGELASAAAAVAIGKERTCVCTAAELEEHVVAGGKCVDDVARLATRVELYRRQGRRIVFTNGCFDLLHRGHITYLVRAKTLGDVLVVGVNSDASVARRKGPGRPVTGLKDRLEVLGELSCIDYLIAFDGDTPEDLIRALRPDVLVKGGDYTRSTIPEAALVESLGGTVQVLPYIDGCSTTAIIRRIQQAASDRRGQEPAPLS